MIIKNNMINLECLSAACILPLLYDSLKLCVATISAVPGHAVLAVPDDAVPAVLGGAVPAGDSHTKPLRPKYMNVSKKSTKTFCIQAKCIDFYALIIYIIILSKNDS